MKSDGKKECSNSRWKQKIVIEYRNLPRRAVLKRSGKPNLHIAVKNEKPIKGRIEIIFFISIKTFYDFQS